MGVCASCLGNRNKDVIDDDEESPFFLDDSNIMDYGSFEDAYMTGQDDLPEVEGELEALQRVLARTSDNMVDIYEIMPQESPIHPATPYTYAGQDARMARYQHLLSKLSGDGDEIAPASVDWLGAGGDGHIEMQRGGKAEAVADQPLVGTFADAAEA